MSTAYRPSGATEVRHALAAFALYTAVAAAATWPLVRYMPSRLAGDSTDSWQTLWGFWWWRHGAQWDASLMFSDLVWWPHGAPLWFQTWDIPSAVVGALAWGLIPEVFSYNVLLFLTFPLSGLAAYLLCRELGGGALASALAGCLYTFSTFHFAHANAVLHMSSLQWSPLYFVGLLRLHRQPSRAHAVLTGASLALATLASPYHLALCAAGTCALALAGGVGTGSLTSAAGRRFVALSVLVFGALAGWLLVGMVGAYLSGSYVGAHPPEKFSADVQSFFLPNAVSIWSDDVTAWKRWNASHWTGTTGLWSNAAYIGYIALGLALLGARANPVVRPFLAVAGLGAVLAIGPRLQFGGTVYGGIMPHGLLGMAIPGLSFSGVPSRFSWLVTFGIAVAASAGLAQLCQRGRRGRAIAIGATVLALVEVWPRPMVLSSYPSPPVLAEWAKDRDRWAVLDTTWWARALWHQTQHRHPIVGGYLSRAPAPRWAELSEDPVLSAFFKHMVSAKRGIAAASPSDMRNTLQRLNVRFVIVDPQNTALPVALGFAPRYATSDLAIFEVPAAVGTSN